MNSNSLSNSQISSSQMASSQSSSSTPQLSKGTERALECIDLKHFFPIPLYLTREVLMDNIRHKAKNVTISYNQLPNDDFKVTIKDDGDGKAEAARLIAPAEGNGLGTSRYGHGLRIYRLKSAGRDEPWTATWKTAGDSFYKSLDQSSVHSEANSLKQGGLWETPESHGFTFETKLKLEALNDRKPWEIAPILREICCASMTPETLASIHIRIEVNDKEGNPFSAPPPEVKLKKDGTPRKTKATVTPKCLGVVDSQVENWQSILSVLEENHVGEFPSSSSVLSTQASLNAAFYIIKTEGTKPVNEFMPNFTSKKSNFALVVQDGFITEVPLAEALKRAAHPSSLNGRFMVLKVDRPLESISLPDEDKLTPEEVMRRKEAIRQASILEPASSKMTYLGKVYTETLEYVRKEKPSAWVSFKKKDTTPSTSDGSESDSSKTKSKRSVRVSHSDSDEATIPTATPSIARLRELAVLLLEEAKLHGTETFNVPLDALEDWVENGNSNNDDI
jgi:hypothetical protein